MADLIDRQAALDAIKAWYADYPLELQEPIDDCWNSVRELPAVQPDHIADVSKKVERTAESAQPEITRCKDCKYMIDTGDDLMCDNAKGWVVATTSDFGCVLAERRME